MQKERVDLEVTRISRRSGSFINYFKFDFPNASGTKVTIRLTKKNL